MIEILNLGAGVQSSTLAFMSIKGELPKIDHAIFSDTGWEPQRVYKWFEWLRPQLEDAGTQVHVVSNGNLREAMMGKGERFAAIPYFVKKADGTTGMVKRQCTNEYKILPIERFIKTEILGLPVRARYPKELVCNQWFGISLDEIFRAKGFPGSKWRKAYYPLIDLRMRRSECLAWMERNGYPEPPRSACIGCPFKNNYSWRKTRQDPEEWKDAIEVDEAIRHRLDEDGVESFLHRSAVPLADAQIDDYDPGQMTLWQDECEGYCGN